MKRLLILAATAWLSACAATSGVIPIGPDTYSITSHDNGPASSLTALKADAYRMAGAHCKAQGKTMNAIGATDTPRSLGQFPQTELRFTCV